MQQKIVSQTAQKQSSLIVTMTLVTRHLCSPRNDGISETRDNLRFKKMRSMDTDKGHLENTIDFESDNYSDSFNSIKV